jgi:hypothetical protein
MKVPLAKLQANDRAAFFFEFFGPSENRRRSLALGSRIAIVGMAAAS